MKKRLEALKKDQKGFTLVELIVVLVILAILAALLVPALLGYIDKARNAKYLEEARSIYTAIQAVNDEQYAKSGNPLASPVNSDVNALVDPTEVTGGTITYRNSSGTNEHDKFIVKSISNLTFKSQEKGKVITANMDEEGSWTVTNIGNASN